MTNAIYQNVGEIPGYNISKENLWDYNLSILTLLRMVYNVQYNMYLSICIYILPKYETRNI